MTIFVPTDRRTEDQIHRDAAAILKMSGVLRDHVIFHHSPNQGDSKGWNGKKKALGMRPGWPDLEFMALIRNTATLQVYCQAHFIELKTRLGKLSPAQIECRADLLYVGAKYEICRSTSEVLVTLGDWGLLAGGLDWEEL